MVKNKKITAKKASKNRNNKASSTFPKMLKDAKTLAEIFELVKDGVYDTIGHKRPGLMLGLTEIQTDQKKLIGGFHPLGSNFIIINKAPLRKIMEKNKKLYQPYVFHMLLREYMHSFGIMDETVLKQSVKNISEKLFGKQHMVTALSTRFNKYFPNVIYSSPEDYVKQENSGIEMVDNFDSSSTYYLR
ncbi:MAG: hypothetical protein HYT71_04255 [Candidatus Aenigmarchaeota archaeon]|nr:hypothetical protein [Candidatus Aenigmarchaeota archaeon]